LSQGLVIDLVVEWDASGPVLDAIICRESVLKAELDHWDASREACPSSPNAWAVAGSTDGWGVSEERVVSVEVRSHIEESRESSACRFRLFSIDLN
jgi:hypothetical protein